MLQGGEAEPTGEWPTSRMTAAAVSGALAIAAALATAAVVIEIGGYSHNSFGERVEVAAFLSMSAMGVVLAAAVALGCSDAAVERPAPSAILRIWAYDALGVISAATVAASLWGMVDAFRQGTSGGAEPRFALARFEFATGELAPLLLAIAAIGVIVRARRRGHSVDAVDADTDEPAPAVFADGLVGPTIGCLLAGGIFSLLVAVTSGFSRSTASAGDRIAGVATTAGQITIAFIAFAVVVLVAIARNARAPEQDADPVTTAAGVIGVVATIAAVYSVYAVVVTKISAGGTLPSVTASWWVRGGEIANALAAGTIGFVAVTLARQLRAPTTDPQPRRYPVASTLRAGARTTAAFLAASSAAYAAYTVTSILELRDLGGPIKTSVSDVIASEAQFVLVAAGLALAAALVMAASRPDVTGHDTLNDIVDAVVGVIATAAVAVSGFSICVVLFAHHAAQFSIFGGFNTAQRLQNAGTSLIAALIGAAAVHLVARGRQIVADRETEREVERLDLLS